MPEPSPQDQIKFLTDIQRLIADGQFVASYKYALLLALADLAVEGGDTADETLPTRRIAEKFIQYYWRQSVPYPGKGVLLKQNTGRQAGIINQLEQVRRISGLSLSALKAEDRRWTKLVTAVEQTVRVMPLWKLQTVGRQRMEFLYTKHPDPKKITLKPGVGYCLRKFHSLITDIVRGAWVRYIRRVNEGVFGTASDLHSFLFGAERANLAQIAPVLEELQDGKCFYCPSRLHRGSTHIDHFIPWSRYPVDLVHNFVLAHGSCNSSKGDRLAAVDHLENWVERNRLHGPLLDQTFRRRDFICDLPATQQVARWAYSQTAESMGLTWMRGQEMVPLGAGWGELLSDS